MALPPVISARIFGDDTTRPSHHSYELSDMRLRQTSQLQSAFFCEQKSHAESVGIRLRPSPGYISIGQSNFGRDLYGSILRFGTENALPSLHFFNGSEPDFELRLPGLVAG
jgi:hypothetical protein